MFKLLRKIEYTSTSHPINLNLDDIIEGVNYLEDFIIYRKDKNFKIYSRICDHAGGKIISRKGENICPMHNWKFDPMSGKYSNGLKKKELNYKIDNKSLNLEKKILKPKIKKFVKKDKRTNIRFLNHAFLNISGEDFSFCTDPWAIGPAFNTGWWLKHKTKEDWEKNLNDSNFIFISHNHPDHLHPLTLSRVNKNIPIVVPKFTNDSAGKFVEELGFKNVIRLSFDNEYNLENSDLVISLFKSGDFREDSGIYFSNGNFEGLLSVDSNMLNFDRYPKVDFYGGSFAGGASGYPLMFENYEEDAQLKISEKQKFFLRQTKFEQLKLIKPKFFLPYAGFFQEKLSRDKRILKYNAKNKINDYKKFCDAQNIHLLNVEDKDTYTFQGSNLKESSNIPKKYFKDLSEKDYLNFFKNEYATVDKKFLKDYFINSGYKDDLTLFISLTDDNFSSVGLNYSINFSKDEIIFSELKKFSDQKILKETSANRVLLLKVRKESFLNTIYNKLPWEDLLIGFQCKVMRNPNNYNVKFWYHFTNIYITSKHVRMKTDCNSCMKLIEYFDQNAFRVSV